MTLDLSGLNDRQQGLVIHIAEKDGDKAAMLARVLRKLNERKAA